MWKTLFSFIWDLIKGYFAEKKAEQDTRLALHQQAQTTEDIQIIKDLALRIYQLKFAANNAVLQDTSFLLAIIPILLVPFCPDAVHQFFLDLNRSVPIQYQAFVASMWATIWGWGQWKQTKGL